MPIVNGKMVDKKPFSFAALIYGMLNLIQLFFATLMPGSATIDDRIEGFNNSKKPGYFSGGGGGGGGGRGANIRGVDHRSSATGAMGGCGGGGCSGGGCGG